MSEERWPLPRNWRWRKAGDFARIIGGGTPPANDETNFDDDGIPWITPADLTGYQETYISRGRRGLSQKGLAACGARLLPAGTILYSSRAPIGYCVIASNPIATNQGFKSFVLRSGDLPEFIRYYLIASTEYAESLASGTTFKELSGARIAEMMIPIPPPDEQRNIVARLDSLLTRSKSAREELAHLPRLIERYKQSILAAAFRGDLTTEWKKSHPGDTADFLELEGIPRLYNGNLPKLPSGWCWVAAGRLCAVKSGVALGKKRAPGAVLVERPYLRVANVQRGWLNLDEIKTIAVTEQEAEALHLQPGDVLMNEGGDRDKLGRGWIWDGEVPHCIHQNHVFRLRPRTAAVPSKYISYYANEFGQSYFLREGKQTTNLASVSMTKVSALPIPITSPNEMALIVAQIESMFAHVDRIAGETARASDLVDRLDQAALEKAFQGRLLAP